MRYLIGIDIGTSGTKSILVDEEGRLIASATAEYPMQQPQNGWAEQDPEDWWNGVCVTLRQITRSVPKECIAGIGLSGQMNSLVMLDKADSVIRPAILWCDQRTGAECEQIERIIGREKLVAITANPALPGFTASKLVWVKDHEPENYAQCAHILLAKDYIRFKLTGEYATEVSDASGMQLLDVPGRCWSKEVCDALGVDMTWLPKVYESPEVTGFVKVDVAALTGLPAGIPVAGGGGDNAAAAVGTGVYAQGKAFTSIGTSGDNFASRFGRKSGHRNQMESVFMALQLGWSRERIGSHIIRNNVIHDCGQNAIVGHMGCAFSTIEHNHIYNISIKREYWGHEMGGIKLHAAVDVVIKNNNIHHCGLGTWLEWQAQGTRVTGNVYHNNDRDFMIEVTHGPCVVDNNIMLSSFGVDNHAQGTAFVHNLIAGVIRPRKILKRDTPYHFHHSTQVAGFSPVLGGDDRVINNIFLGVQEGWGEPPKHTGNFCEVYDDYSTPEEYPELLKKAGTRHNTTTYADTPQPVWIEGNAYAGLAKAFRAEKGDARMDGMEAVLEEQNGEWVLTVTLPDAIKTCCTPVTTPRLGAPRLTEQPYDEADGNDIDFTADMLGEERTEILPGPFAKLVTGKQSFVVWKA